MAGSDTERKTFANYAGRFAILLVFVAVSVGLAWFIYRGIHRAQVEALQPSAIIVKTDDGALNAADAELHDFVGLTAQLDMAEWAFIAALAAISTLVVSSIGVWAVVDTLAQTKRVTALTQEFGERQNAIGAKQLDASRSAQAAFLHIDDIVLSAERTDAGILPSWHVTIRNIGRSAAYQIRHECDIRLPDGSTAIWGEKEPGGRAKPYLGVEAIRALNTDDTRTLQDSFVRAINLPAAGGASHIDLFGTIIWRDIFDRRRGVRYSFRAEIGGGDDVFKKLTVNSDGNGLMAEEEVEDLLRRLPFEFPSMKSR